MSKRVLIVGGGAAGWMAALYCKRINPNLSVELIESEEIGIIGAGESTTSTFSEMLNFINIDVREFIRETDATIKTSIKFDDWDFPNSSYLSTFTPWLCSRDTNRIPWGRNSEILSRENVPDYLLYCYANNIDPNKVGVHKFALENKVPVIQIDDEFSSTFMRIQGSTYNINAKLTAKFFRKKAENRGVIRHEGKIIKINGHYPIESVEDDKGRIHKVDFVFDCTGFARLIIGKHLNANWIDYSKYLTVDSAIPFFLPTDKQIPTYTQATAMKYGWMFKVPTQKRYGCGYVYDSNYITKEQAIQEVEEKLGHKIELVNFFRFKTGFFENIFISNCIALGLSSNFLEPMAATNLTLVSTTMRDLSEGFVKEAFDFSGSASEEFKSSVNHKNRKRIEGSSVCEIFSHYVNNRNDTEFWKYYKNVENRPPVFREAYEAGFVQEEFNYKAFYNISQFEEPALVSKIIGNNWFKDRAIKYCQQNNLNEKYAKVYNDLKEYTDFIEPYVLDHRDYLERVCTYD
jgi:tryptophan halogenase